MGGGGGSERVDKARENQIGGEEGEQREAVGKKRVV